MPPRRSWIVSSTGIGGRWNPPDRAGRPGFGALYLHHSLTAARENARRYVREPVGATATLDDIAPSALPDLQHYEITTAKFVDVVTPAGIAEVGLAEAAYEAGDPGLAVVSAVAPREEELVVFDRNVAALAAKGVREAFAAWF